MNILGDNLVFVFTKPIWSFVFLARSGKRNSQTSLLVAIHGAIVIKGITKCIIFFGLKM